MDPMVAPILPNTVVNGFTMDPMVAPILQNPEVNSYIATGAKNAPIV